MPAELNARLALVVGLALALCGYARADTDAMSHQSAEPGRADALNSLAPPRSKEAEFRAAPTPVLPPDGQQKTATEITPDDSAVRYYASRNETVRVNAEIGRLKRLYPGWQPPKALYDAPTSSVEDEAQLWSLFSADRMDELNAAISARKASEHGWQPSADLQQKILRKTTRLKISEYLKQDRWQEIVDYVHAVDLSVDAEVDVLWAVAEAFARTKQTAESRRLYGVILTNDKSPAERISTIQKAMANLRMADVEPLIAMGAQANGGSSEFAPIMIDITRARISAYLHSEREQDIPDTDMRAFQDFARAAPDANQAGLVGWYNYAHRNYGAALEWFKLSISRGGDAMVAHGLAHSLRALGYNREVEEVAYAWRQPLINNAVLFIDILETDLTREIPPFIEPERLSRYADETLRLSSGEGAQALAWYSYNTCQFETALAWFERADAWHPKEATTYGYALTLRRLRMRKRFFEVVNRYDGLFPKVVGLIFPDNTYHPPTPCDRQPAVHSAQVTTADGVPIPQPASFQPTDIAALSEMDVKSRTKFALASRTDRMPSISHSDFPVAVDSQNALRFPTFAGNSALVESSESSASALLNETAALDEPLVARRVPGVGPMPYERYGYSLLAAYNGQKSASAPHSALYAPAGTLWSRQMAEAGTSPIALQFPTAGVAIPSSSIIQLPATDALLRIGPAAEQEPAGIIATKPTASTGPSANLTNSQLRGNLR
jgi:hypothetical protein